MHARPTEKIMRRHNVCQTQGPSSGLLSIRDSVHPLTACAHWTVCPPDRHGWLVLPSSQWLFS